MAMKNKYIISRVMAMVFAMAGATAVCFAAEPAAITGKWSMSYTFLGEKLIVIFDLDKQVAMVRPDNENRLTPLKRMHEGTFVVDFGFGDTQFQIKRKAHTAVLCYVEEPDRCEKLHAVPQ